MLEVIHLYSYSFLHFRRYQKSSGSNRFNSYWFLILFLGLSEARVFWIDWLIVYPKKIHWGNGICFTYFCIRPCSICLKVFIPCEMVRIISQVSRELIRSHRCVVSEEFYSTLSDLNLRLLILGGKFLHHSKNSGVKLHWFCHLYFRKKTLLSWGFFWFVCLISICL